MAFPDIFKLTKLKIQAFSDDKRQKEIKPAFEAMFNPGGAHPRIRTQLHRRTDRRRYVRPPRACRPCRLDE